MKPIALHAHNPGPITGAGNWTWLLPGRVPTIVDAGTGAPAHLEAVVRALGGAALAQVLVTHAHGDHASGAPALAARYPGVRCRKMPWPARDAAWPVPWLPIDDGDRVEAGDAVLVAVHTPGHAPDHLCFWHEETRALFGGDLAIRGSTVWIPASRGGDLAAYLDSLRRVIDLGPLTIFPAHGPVIDDPVPLLRDYLRHRAEREAQIVGALERGDADVDAILARVYAGLRPSLLPMARESVLAHLAKLERERRVRCEGGRWHMIGP